MHKTFIALALLVPAPAFAACSYPNVIGQGAEAVLAAQQAYQACVDTEFRNQQIWQQQLQQQQQMRQMQRQQEDMQRQIEQQQIQLQQQQEMQRRMQPQNNSVGWPP
jgi:TolA-binding protein